MTKRTNTKAMVESALLIALGIVLAQIKIFQMPYGGSVTLVSSLPFILISYRHGIRWGLTAGITNGCLQMLTGWYAPPAGTVSSILACVLLDYLLAFVCLGTADIFRKPFRNTKAGIGISTWTVIFMRFLCSFLSGALLWGSYQSYYEWAEGMSVWTYSLIYNGSYMLPEMIITTAVACILASVYPKLFEKQ